MSGPAEKPPTAEVTTASSAILTNPSSLRGHTRWFTVNAAAPFLGFAPSALRKQLERRAKPVEDGTEAILDGGVRGRKLGRHWRLQLSDAWLRGDGK